MLLALAMGCAASPATVHKLDSGDLRATWAGYEIDVPKDAVELHGFEVTPVPSEDDHWPPPGTRNYRDIPFEPVTLVEGEWMDGETEAGDIDIFVFRGSYTRHYNYFIYTRHDVVHGAWGPPWVQLKLEIRKSDSLCHWVDGEYAVNHDDRDTSCFYRRAFVPVQHLPGGDDFYISIVGDGRYSLLVAEQH